MQAIILNSFYGSNNMCLNRKSEDEISIVLIEPNCEKDYILFNAFHIFEHKTSFHCKRTSAKLPECTKNLEPRN